MYLTKVITYEQEKHLDSIRNICFTFDSINMHITS